MEYKCNYAFQTLFELFVILTRIYSYITSIHIHAKFHIYACILNLRNMSWFHLSHIVNAIFVILLSSTALN